MARIGRIAEHDAPTFCHLRFLYQVLPMPKEKTVDPARAESRAVLARRASRCIEKLRRAALALEERHAPALEATAPAMAKSARNLVHYLAVRAHDIRGLQADLARLGLSSLGRMEAHAMASRGDVTDTAMAGRTECVMLNKGPFIRKTLAFQGPVPHRVQAHQNKKTATIRRLGVSRMEH